MCYAAVLCSNTALLATLNSALAAGHARIESCDSAFIEGAIDQDVRAITVESKEIKDLYTAHKLLAFLVAALRMLKEAGCCMVLLHKLHSGEPSI
jgi:hypothetical protein